MGKYFTQGTALAGYEREMMKPPNFIPRGGGRMAVCRFRCRPEAGTATLEELTRELSRAWGHPRLRHRAMQAARRAGGFRFADPYQPQRILEVLGDDKDFSDSGWLAAVYLLSASDRLWQGTKCAVQRERVDFSAVQLRDADVRDYTLYRAARGVCRGRMGIASEELADAGLVDDETLLQVLNAALIARFGPEVMAVGREGVSYA